jgi:hypothetical protein
LLDDDLIARFATLFRGYARAYGVYVIDSRSRRRARDRKLEGTAKTVRGDVTLDLYRHHLGGEVGLGIVPVDERGLVTWAAVDVDVYEGLDLAVLARRATEVAARYGISVVVCRSKSGGAHIFLFFLEPTSAKLARDVAGALAGALGHGRSEIFPKQDKIVEKRQDTGSWINLPYFDAEQTLRYALGPDGEPISSLADFLLFAEARRTPPDALLDFLEAPPEESVGSDAIDPLLDGAPICLIKLATGGIGEGGRNVALFNLITYAKQRWPDDWKTKASELNDRFLSLPLPKEEVAAAVRSHSKKTYHYQCKVEPLVSHCQRAACSRQRFGIRRGESLTVFPAVIGVRRFPSEPPRWMVDLEDYGTVEIDSDQISKPEQFRAAVLNQLHKALPVLKRDAFHSLIDPHIQSAEIVELGLGELDDLDPRRKLWNLAREYASADFHVSAYLRDVRTGRVVVLPDGRRAFLLDGFARFLESRGIEYSNTELVLLARKVLPPRETLDPSDGGPGVTCYALSPEQLKLLDPLPVHEDDSPL